MFSCSKSSVSCDEAQQKFNKLRAKYRTTPFIFTDGSKNDQHTANGIVCGRHENLARLDDGTSIFLAELHAIYLALKFIESKKLRHAVICSDSRSVIQSLMRNSELSPLLISVLNKHQELCEAGVKIQFLWIPGHSGIKGNERADQIAKDALTFVIVTKLLTDFSSIKSSIRRATYTTGKVSGQTTKHKPN